MRAEGDEEYLLPNVMPFNHVRAEGEGGDTREVHQAEGAEVEGAGHTASPAG